MGKSTGFLEYQRKDGPETPAAERIKDFREFHGRLSLEEQCRQGARCMNCGIPYCQAGDMIAGMVSGCPLHNLIPEINDLICQENWEQAYYRLSKTHNFPEFTSRVCPALCEAACACGIHDEPVASKENEKAIIEYAFENGLVKPDIPKVRTGKRIAIVGSGPAGLAAAVQLNKRGHSVTIYEKSDKAGGLLRYGIPNMKLEKEVVDRRIRLMEASGIQFIYNTNVGEDITGEELMNQYDRVILACGASKPREVDVPGREADGIYFAVPFLTEVTKKLQDTDFQIPPCELVQGKNVVIIGGGDTGNDCAGTVIRLGAASVAQIEIKPEPPKVREESNPWPEWPKILKTDYGQQEAKAVYGEDPRRYQTTVSEFIKDEDGKVCGVKIIHTESKYLQEKKRTEMIPVEGTEELLPADLVLIAAGFQGCETYIPESFAVEVDERTNVKTEKQSWKTNIDKVFTAGDMHRGQSLVVWAIAEGRNAAKEVDESLMGYTNL